MDFTKFNELVNLDELASAIQDAGAPTERLDVPFGDYEVKITKLTIEECPFDGDYKGKPQLSVWFKIINGEYTGQMLFYTRRLLSDDVKKSGFMIKMTNDFLNSLESGIPADFGGSFAEYASCIDEIYEAIETAEYQLSYAENAKGYKEYNIVQRFK